MPDDDSEDPMIRFGGEWTPAHEVWKKMETATVVADAIDRFNEGFPHLSSAETRDVVPLVRKRLKEIELRMPSRDSGLPDLGPVALDLLASHSPEDTLDVLQNDYGVKLGVQQLIQLAGVPAYVDALKREASDYASNGISAEQTGQLWNDIGRPAPGGGLWNAAKVSRLLGGGG
jgi:hypothetical protein